MRHHALLLLFLFGILIGKSASAELVASPPSWHCVQSGSEVDLAFPCNHPVDSGTWTFKVNGRSTLQQSAVITDGVAHAKFELPKTVEGAVIDASVEVQLQSAKHGSLIHEHPLYVFSNDLIKPEISRLKAANLKLYDPAGHTLKAFTASGVPIKACRTQAACESLKKGILIIGEGNDWNRQRGLAEVAVKLPRQGVSVLCLAPKSAAFSPVMSFSADTEELPGAIEILDAQVLRKMDKRFDILTWNGKSSIHSTMRMSASRGAVQLKVHEDRRGWPWYQSQLPKTNAAAGAVVPTFTCCGFGIIERWDDGPMAQLLFLHLIETLSPSTVDKNTQ